MARFNDPIRTCAKQASSLSLPLSLSLKGERISIRLAGFHFREIRAYLIASFLLEMLNTELPT